MGGGWYGLRGQEVIVESGLLVAGLMRCLSYVLVTLIIIISRSGWSELRNPIRVYRPTHKTSQAAQETEPRIQWGVGEEVGGGGGGGGGGLEGGE